MDQSAGKNDIDRRFPISTPARLPKTVCRGRQAGARQHHAVDSLRHQQDQRKHRLYVVGIGNSLGIETDEGYDQGPRAGKQHDRDRDDQRLIPPESTPQPVKPSFCNQFSELRLHAAGKRFRDCANTADDHVVNGIYCNQLYIRKQCKQHDIGIHVQKIRDVLTDPRPFLVQNRACLSGLRQRIVLSHIKPVQQRPHGKDQTAPKLHPEQLRLELRQQNHCGCIDDRSCDHDAVVDILPLVGNDQCQVRQTAHIFCKR